MKADSRQPTTPRCSVPRTWSSSASRPRSDADGEPDLRAVLSAARAIGDHLQPETLVVLQSTCPPGTTARVLVPELERGSGLRADEDFFVVYAPERIDPGNARFGVRNTPKLIGGASADSTELARTLFETCVDEVIAVSSPEVAELAKLVENTFRFVNIGFANEMALLCERLHVNVWEVLEAAATKPFAVHGPLAEHWHRRRLHPGRAVFLESAARDNGLDLHLIQASASVDCGHAATDRGQARGRAGAAGDEHGRRPRAGRGRDV